LLDQFFLALRAMHPDILYVHDEDLYRLVDTGNYESTHGKVRVRVRKRLTSIHRRPAEQLGA